MNVKIRVMHQNTLNGDTHMPRKIKVYGWIGARPESRVEGNRHGQTREIVAAASMAEVLRITGMKRDDFTRSGCETGNQEELELALSKPGVVFWQPLYRDNEWREAAA